VNVQTLNTCASDTLWRECEYSTRIPLATNTLVNRGESDLLAHCIRK